MSTVGKISIRKFTNEDALEVTGLIKAALYKVSAKYYPKNIIRNLIEHYSAKMLVNKNKTRPVFVATIKNKIVGTVQLAEDGWICAMFVRNGYQKHGIGTRMLEKIEDVARKKKVDALRSHVAINSVDFYKKSGFKIVKMVTLKEAGRVYRTIKKLG